MTYFDYFKVFLLKVGILNFVHISSNENNYCDIRRNECGIYYCLNNKLHRLDGAAIKWRDGYKAWYQNGKLHRIGGPARKLSNGSKFWFQNNKLHRIDGPAIEYSNGYKIWYYEGELIDCDSQEEFERYIKLKLFW